ncbi:MAG: tripartite tricarboxylate transporter TctB family protein [Alphaproteobacteria bacterium]|nr:tripartite tricarboxylate transporter TctB family protein [Alphaproteobacteria bacterium]
MPRIRDPRELAAGLFLILVAALALILSDHLPIGRLVNMGPGYVPRALAWILGGLGVIVALSAFTADAPADVPPLTEWAWRPLLALTASILVFAFLLERAGLVICIVVTVGVAGLAAAGIRPIQSLLLGGGLALMSALLFVVGLGLPLRLWPEFAG